MPRYKFFSLYLSNLKISERSLSHADAKSKPCCVLGFDVIIEVITASLKLFLQFFNFVDYFYKYITDIIKRDLVDFDQSFFFP